MDEHSEQWLMGYKIGFEMPYLLPPSTAREFVDGFTKGRLDFDRNFSSSSSCSRSFSLSVEMKEKTIALMNARTRKAIIKVGGSLFS
jgi:hypothetical protein